MARIIALNSIDYHDLRLLTVFFEVSNEIGLGTEATEEFLRHMTPLLRTH